MPAVYEKSGIRFSYPENWIVDEEDATEGQTSISVSSPGGLAFWTIVIHTRTVEPKALALRLLTWSSRWHR